MIKDLYEFVKFLKCHILKKTLLQENGNQQENDHPFSKGNPTKDEIDKYINWLIRNNRLLYLNEKKLHTQDNTGIYLPNATTLLLTGANTNNIHEYKKISIKVDDHPFSEGNPTKKFIRSHV